MKAVMVANQRPHPRDPAEQDTHCERSARWRQREDLAVSDRGDRDRGHVQRIHKWLMLNQDIPRSPDSDERRQDQKSPNKTRKES